MLFYSDNNAMINILFICLKQKHLKPVWRIIVTETLIFWLVVAPFLLAAIITALTNHLNIQKHVSKLFSGSSVVYF